MSGAGTRCVEKSGDGGVGVFRLALGRQVGGVKGV